MSDLHFSPSHALTPLLTARALVVQDGTHLHATEGCVWEPTAVTALFFAAMRELTGKLPDETQGDANYGMVDGDQLYHLFASLQFMAEEEAADGQEEKVVAVVLDPHLDQAVIRLQEGDTPASSWISPLEDGEEEDDAEQ